MIVAMQKGASKAQIDAVIQKITQYDLSAIDLPGGERTAIGISSAIPSNLRVTLKELLETLEGVDRVTQVSRSYKLASREFHPTDSLVDVNGVIFGGNEIIISAGPCTIESEEQLFLAADYVKKTGGKVLRGGAFKPRTSPYAFQGMGVEGLKIMKKVGDAVGLLTISEVMDQHDIDIVCDNVDILQIGARNMQNYPLLLAVGKTNKPVVLKRGSSATIDEWLLAAEYILSQGNPNVILCERGVHPLDREHTRYTLDLSAVPVVKNLSHLPIIVDPSHSSGNWKYVSAMSKGAVAVGADGLIVEIHPNPSDAVCDGAQSLKLEGFSILMSNLKLVAKSIGRIIA